jgi:hypothetical protein
MIQVHDARHVPSAAAALAPGVGGGVGLEDAPHLGYDARAVTVLEEAMALGVVPQVPPDPDPETPLLPTLMPTLTLSPNLTVTRSLFLNHTQTFAAPWPQPHP